MPRYELSGEYFWSIELADKTIKTSLGKIGNEGHTRMKSYASAAEARRAHDQLVAEKLEQGYVLIAPSTARVKAKPARSRRS